MNSETEKYPLPYKEFEQRVTGLFLARAKKQSEFEFRKYILKEEVDDFIECLYKEACYNYNNPDYPSNPFTFGEICNQPVKILEIISKVKIWKIKE